MLFKPYGFDYKFLSSLRLAPKTALTLVLLSSLASPVLGMDVNLPGNNGGQHTRPRSPKHSSEDDQGPSKYRRTASEESQEEDFTSEEEEPPYLPLCLSFKAYQFLVQFRKYVCLHMQKHENLNSLSGVYFLEWVSLTTRFTEQRDMGLFKSEYDKRLAGQVERALRGEGMTASFLKPPILWQNQFLKELFETAQKDLKKEETDSVMSKLCLNYLYFSYGTEPVPGFRELKTEDDASFSNLKYCVLLWRFASALNGSERETKKLSKDSAISKALDSFTPDNLLKYLKKEYAYWRCNKEAPKSRHHKTSFVDNPSNVTLRNTIKDNFLKILERSIESNFLVTAQQRKEVSNLKAAFEGDEEKALQFVGPCYINTLHYEILESIFNPWLVIEDAKNVRSLGNLQLANKNWNQVIGNFRKKQQTIPCYYLDETVEDYITCDYLASIKHAFPKQEEFSLEANSQWMFPKHCLFSIFQTWPSLTSLKLERRPYGLTGIHPYLTNLSELSLTYGYKSGFNEYKNSQLQSLTVSRSGGCYALHNAQGNEDFPAHFDKSLKELHSICPNLTFLNLENPRICNVNSLTSLTKLKNLRTFHLKFQKLGEHYYYFTPDKLTAVIDVLTNIKLKRLELGDYPEVAGYYDITPDHPDLHQLYLRGVEIVWQPDDEYYPKNAPSKTIKCNEGWETRKAEWTNALETVKQ